MQHAHNTIKQINPTTNNAIVTGFFIVGESVGGSVGVGVGDSVGALVVGV
jgi:hypothetical protein